MDDFLPLLTKEPLFENRASDIVHANLTSYLSEVIRMQFPDAVSGLKKVQLRFLWAGRKGEFNDEVKSQIVIGAIGKLHNYGDDSAYKALVRMAQAWNVNPPIVYIEGNSGSYSGDTAANQRYTALELTAFAKDVFYGGIDLNVLPMTPGATGEFEPSYFIPTVPTALLYNNLTVGYGYQSNTVALNLANVCDLVSAYGLHQTKALHKSFDYAKHAEKFLPDFPNPCILTNADDLVAAYRRGEFDTRILLDGRVILSHDRIMLLSLPDAARFAGAEGVIEDAIRDSIKKKTGSYDAWINAMYPRAANVNIGGLLIELKRGVNVFDVWDELRRMLHFSDSMTPNPNYATSNGKLIRLSVLLLLQIWYDKRYAALMASKRRRLESMTRNLRILEARLIVYAHIDEVIALIRGQQTRADAISLLQSRFNISAFQATALVQTEIGDLSKTSREDLISRKEKQAADIAKLNISFGKIGEEISQEAQRIKKTYPFARKTTIPTYIGAVSTAGGVIQLETTDELVEIATRFPKGDLRVMMYDGPYLLHVTPDRKPSRKVASKYTRGDIYGLSFEGDRGYTVALSEGAACCVPGVVPGLRVDGYYYTAKLAKALTRKGEVRTIDVTEDLAFRKIIGRGTNTDIIYLYPNTTETHYLVILNDNDLNTVCLQRVEDGAGKIMLSPVGHLVISHSFTGRDWYVSIPENYLNRVSARIFHIVDAEALLGKNRLVRLDLASSKTKRLTAFNMLA